MSPDGGGPSELVLYVVAQNKKDRDPVFFLKKTEVAIKSNLNPLFRVSDVVLVDSLPRTASNKVMRRELRRRHETCDMRHE